SPASGASARSPGSMRCAPRSPRTSPTPARFSTLPVSRAEPGGARRGRRLTVVVPATAHGERLGRFLATRAQLGTRPPVKQLVSGGRGQVDGVARRAGFLLRAGAEIAIDVPAPEPARVEPEDIGLEVLFEDAALLAINKPPGMVVHPAPGARRGTVVAAV